MPEPGNETMELLDRATAAHSGGDTGLALRLVDDAIARLPGDDHALRTFVLVQKAGWLRESGAPSEAAGILEEVARELDRLPVSGYEAQRASLRMEQALHAKLRGDFAAAEEALLEGEALAADSPARDLLLTDMHANRAGVYMDQGRYSQAQDVLLAALEIDRRIGNKRAESNDLNMLGLVYQGLKDEDTARAYLARAFEVAFESKLAHEAIEAMSNLGALMDDMGDHAGAGEIFGNIERMSLEGGDASSLACSVANQGVAAARAGRDEEALSLFKRSHELHLKAGNQLHGVQDQLNLSGVECQLGRPAEGLAYAEEALETARELGLMEILWAAEYSVADCSQDLALASRDDSEKMRRFEEAMAGYRRAADMVELLRAKVDRPEERESLLGGREMIYDRAIALSLAFGRVKDAFRFSERARMRSFLEALGSARLERLEDGDPAVAQRRLLVERLMDSGVAPAEKADVMEELRRLRAQMIARRPAVAAITEAELPSEDDIRTAIPADAHVLELYTTENVIVQFLLGPDGLKDCSVTRLEEPVQDLVQRFREEIDAGDPELESGHALFAALIRPAMPLLSKCAKLIVVPHGSLHYVPFNALWFVPAGVDAPPRQYLKTRFLLATVPSTSYLFHLDRASKDRPEPGPPVVIGNPTGDLEGAEREVEGVAAKLGVSAIVGAQANRGAVLDCGSPSVLHVASHGAYNDTDPLLSGLQLADGLLTVEELIDSGPVPTLFVLSGCVTGVSKRRPGEELVGLAQAALRRGTRSVVATLWETFDESSPQFFEHFYDALAGGSSVSESLAWAREGLAEGPDGYDQPVDWAPFILIGDPDMRVGNLAEAPTPSFDRGNRLAQEGDLAGAKVAYQAAIDDGSPREAAWAAFALGTLLDGEGDRLAALEAYTRAIDSGDPVVAPMATSAVARLIEGEDADRAKALYRQAIAARHREASPNAALDLGALLLAEGDVGGARAAFEEAMYSVHPTAGPKGAYNLGILLTQSGDLDGARAAFQHAMDGEDEDIARAAARDLRRLPGG